MNETVAPADRGLGAVGALHERFVFGRRTRVLAGQIADFLPRGARVLDVGCGDGTIDRLLLRLRPDLTIEGVDVLLRPGTHIPVRRFDGVSIPCSDASFDVAMLVDVLHHTGDPTVLLREAARVARIIVIKDHLREGFLAGPTLRLMDWVGNAHHGVALPYNYWSQKQWSVTFGDLGLEPTRMTSSIGLYPWPASWIFGRRLHFVARLERAG